MILQRIILLFALCVCGDLLAYEVSIEMPGSIHALAEFTEGDVDKPAVLIVHPILQTHHFSTIQQMGDFLAESGYTTLRPTLSLGVDSRKKSLACEAIHTHTMASDIEEIALWARWLQNKSGKPLILIGHSAGASHLLAYLDKYGVDSVPVEKLIFVSPAYFGERPSSYAVTAEIERARQDAANGQTGPAAYGFTYCKAYVTMAAAYLTYLDWSKAYTTERLLAIDGPVKLLFGSGDKRIASSWPHELSAQGMDVQFVEGADHFFHGDYEFDLLDFIDSAVRS